MSQENPLTNRQLCEWFIRRNPSYLVSACLMAAGSRLLLVGSSDPTGDLRLILITLAVLQLYEWMVAGILLVLQRAGRAPEDRPSLLLVASAFWTGPMAATIEMIALRPALGVYVAAGACLIAVAELRLCLRALNIQMSVAGQIVACACVILLATAPPFLKIPESNSGLNEIALYGTWWVFAGLVLLCLAALRPRPAESAGWSEAAFLAMTIAATCVHLIGMNYGFFCHASYFYASPLIVALAVVGFRWLTPTKRAYKAVLALLTIMPGIAILLALQPFNEDVPVARMPPWLRDPMIAMAAMAGAAWWFGYRRHRKRILLHAGCAALALAALRALHGPIDEPVVLASMRVPVLLYGSAAYFMALAWMLRSRLEALAATAIQFVATAMMVRDQTPAAGLIICLAAGWSVWIAVHLAFRRPRWWVRVAPIAYLAIVPWMLAIAPDFQQWITAHALVLVAVLLVVGQLWRWTRYRTIAGLVAAGHLLAAAVKWTLMNARPEAVALVFAGFSLLALGALISWHKQRLLVAVYKPEEVVPVREVPELPI